MIVAAQSTLRQESSAVPLARYAYITRYTECRFWGVYNANDATSVCREILSKFERDMIAKYLAEAQDEIEQVVRYRLAPTWEVDEEHGFTFPIITKWGKVIAPGVRGETTIQAGAAVSHADDPAVVGPIATTVTEADEVVIFHPGTDVEINPSCVTITGGFMTIEIPRCRMVTEDAYAAGGQIAYTDTSNFESTVDVRRVYNDESTQGVMVWLHGKNCLCGLSCCSCSNDTETACLTVAKADVGIIEPKRADYSGGNWVSASIGTCRCPDNILLNYYGGMTPLTPQAEDAIVRLAHSKMPEPPCGCSVLQDLWKRDRNQPEVLTAERLNCPFGLNDGAWIAWRFANAIRNQGGSAL